MATFKAEVYAHQKKKDGTYNIKIRVTHLGKKKYIATPFFVTSDDLTRTLKIKNHRYTDLTDQIIKGYRERCDALGMKINDMSVSEVVEYITTREQGFKLDFIQWCNDCIGREIQEGRTGTAENGRDAVRAFLGWLDDDAIDINQINRAMVETYVEYLQQGGKKPNTIRNRVSCLIKYFNAAIARYNDTDEIIRSNPFAAVKLPRAGVNRKKALTIGQIKSIRDFTPTTAGEELARDAFMLSFYFIGMNAVDLLNCTDINNGVLTYNRTKTKSRRADGAEIRIDIQPEAVSLVEKYKSRFGRLAFMFGERWSELNTFNVYLKRGIESMCKKIGIDGVTFYSARHSWATIAAVDAKIDVYTIHLALNHVSNTMAITETYIKRDFTAINDANRRVLDLLL